MNRTTQVLTANMTHYPEPWTMEHADAIADPITLLDDYLCISTVDTETFGNFDQPISPVHSSDSQLSAWDFGYVASIDHLSYGHFLLGNTLSHNSPIDWEHSQIFNFGESVPDHSQGNGEMIDSQVSGN